MTVLLPDVRFGLRLLQRNPGFACVSILTLALGIAATTAIFSVVYGLFFAPLPYRQADRLVMVWEQDQGYRREVTSRNYVEWKRRSTAFSAINAWGGRIVNLATDERPESVSAGIATPGFLGMLGYGHPLALGLISQQTHDDARTTLQSKQASYDSALQSARNLRASIQASEAAMKLAGRQLRDTEIRAAFDGFVEKRLVNLGELVKSQMPVMAIVRLDPLKVTAELPERAWSGASSCRTRTWASGRSTSTRPREPLSPGPRRWRSSC